MRRYILSRLLLAVPAMLGVFVVVFFVIRMLPGDSAEAMLGASATDAQIETYRAAHGLDKPAPVQFWIALKNLFRGDLGDSLSHYRPVLSVVLERLPSTIELAAYGIVLGSVFAVILGVVAASFRGRWPDLIITAYSTFGMSLPTFYIGLWILMVFAVKLDVIPVSASAVEGLPRWKTLFGPVLTIVVGGSLVRTTRSAILEILEEDFIRTARAKGVPKALILFRHALGNALIPIITMVGYGLAVSFGGAIVLETVFGRSGVGKLLIDAITVRDYPLVQGTTFVIALFMIVANLLTDVAAGFADPRIRVAGAGEL
ncbi:MAG: ABC transporter permease [Oscillospiraceae bacterium]|jgi:ABC-type dipeptide/oligopeptide/nickel transport system permease component|nr:ABC transporter permease [Oscillospiraceae bacterium]